MDSTLSPVIANFMKEFKELELSRVPYKPICWFLLWVTHS